MTTMSLVSIFKNAAIGQFPTADGAVELIPAASGCRAAVVAFTNHIFIAADIQQEWLDANLDYSDISASFSPSFVSALERHIGTSADNADLVMARVGKRETTDISIHEVDVTEFVHSRLERALRFRRNVRAFATPRGDGVVIVGQGAGGRWEVSVDVDESSQGSGLGRSLLAAASKAIPSDEPLFAQVAPGNVASLRACLAGGFVPVASEVLFL